MIEFHTRIDEAEFKPIYEATHPDFKRATSEKDFLALLEAVHRKLGTIQSTSQEGWNVNSMNFKTNVGLSYKTKFAGGDAVETFHYRVEGDKAELVGYHINSTALIVK